MKKSQISEFFNIFQVCVWVALEGSDSMFWVYGNLRGCSRGIYSYFNQVSNFARFGVAGNMKKSQISEFFDIFQVAVWVAPV